MSVGALLKLFVASVAAFAAAFAMLWLFFRDVAPVSWEQTPPSLWALGAAFLLRSVENLAAAVAALTLAGACVLFITNLRSRTGPRGGAHDPRSRARARV